MRKSYFLLTAMAAISLIGCDYRELPEQAPANQAATAAAAPTQAASPTASPTAAAAPSTEAPLARSATDPALKWGPCPAPFPTGCELTVLHGNPATPNADALLRIPGGYVIPPHRHSSAERMILVSGQLEVKYQGAAPATLSAGNYAYGPANMPHRGTCLGTAPCTLFIAFEGPVDVFAVDGAID